MRTRRNPCRILTGDDKRFYLTLPDRLTVYRGCAGVSIEHARLGVCSTTKREIAEWFATRFGLTDPVVLAATIDKREIRIAKASEFEVVTWPRQSRVLERRANTDHKPSARSWTP